jgi:hypothetical protein
MISTHPVRQQRRLAAEREDLARRKLESFERIEQDFIASFIFVQGVHGQLRFASFPVEDTVRYLHALYICECKDRLLSIPQTIRRYDGERSLELLRQWQEGRTAGVVGFIYERLDDQPFAELTEQIEETERASDARYTHRLLSGRAVLLNRLFTLAYALDAIFALDPKKLRSSVRAACKRLGHTPEQIERQLTDMHTDLYVYAPSPALARRNMIVMNSIGSRMTSGDGDRPGERTSRVLPGELPIPPYAESPILGESTLVSMRWQDGWEADAPIITM